MLKMYQTYKNEEIKKPSEEKLIPKEVITEKSGEIKKRPVKENNSLFGGLDNEDIIILGDAD